MDRNRIAEGSMSDSSTLNMLRLPGRVDVHKTATLLGFMDHDIPVLVKVKLLKPLGNPPPNGQRYFSSTVIEMLAKDPEWLDKATKVLTNYWRKKNQARRDHLTTA
jgi:hypothetical protein